MAWTLTTLAPLVGRKLGILAAGEALSAEDSTVIQTAITSAFDDLSGRDIIPGDLASFTTATIPQALGEGFALLAAGIVGSEFGIDDEARLNALRTRGEQFIRRHAQARYTPPDPPDDEPVYGDDDYTGATPAEYF